MTKELNFPLMVSQLMNVIPNPFQAARVLEETLDAHKKRKCAERSKDMRFESYDDEKDILIVDFPSEKFKMIIKGTNGKNTDQISVEINYYGTKPLSVPVTHKIIDII